jgi:hypothetical protein
MMDIGDGKVVSRGEEKLNDGTWIFVLFWTWNFYFVTQLKGSRGLSFFSRGVVFVCFQCVP